MFLQTLLNPFNRVAGFPALFYGCVFMVLTATVAAPCGVNFVGSLNIHVARPMPFGLIFGLLLFGWVNVSCCFYVAGMLFPKSRIRMVDVYGTLALARAPFLVAAPFGLLPGLWNLRQPDQIPAEVFVQTEGGKKYLLGSDTPERLTAVVHARTAESTAE